MDLPPNLSAAAAANLQQWLNDGRFARWRAETEALLASGNIAEIEDAFGRTLRFGTGGIRGRCGAGPGRMNPHVVAAATQGLADYLKDIQAPAAVVIGYDVRRDSREFAETAARVLAAAGMAVHFTDGLCSTPQLSYSVPALSAGAGIMITASHNPPNDNGYKCYRGNGCQFVEPEDEKLAAFVEKAVASKDADLPNFAQSLAAGVIRKVPDSIHRGYVDASLKASRADPVTAAKVRVLYTPYHGVGTTSVLPVLLAAGFAVRKVEAQSDPDPNFSTLPGGSANPEDPKTFDLARAAANDGDDLILSSDPDADRIGALVRKTPAGEWVYLKGNQIAALLCDYLVRRRAAEAPTKSGVVARTIVTTDLIDRIASASGVAVESGLLVGFKYIGRLIDSILTGRDSREFVFGGEESHGYLSGTHCLDKDAANAACVLAAAVAEQKVAGKTVRQRLMELYRQFGLFAHGLLNLSLTPADGGMGRAEEILSKLRANPPKALAGRPVLRVLDWNNGRLSELDVAAGRRTESAADKGNVLMFILSADWTDRITLRPSGTEPKMKLYGQLGKKMSAGAHEAAVEGLLTAAEAELNAMLSAAMKEIKGV